MTASAARASARSRSIAEESVGIGAPATTTVASELLSGFESGVEVVTVAEFVSGPAAEPSSATRMRTTAPDPAGRAPTSAVTIPVVPGAGPPHVPSVV